MSWLQWLAWRRSWLDGASGEAGLNKVTTWPDGAVDWVAQSQEDPSLRDPWVFFLPWMEMEDLATSQKGGYIQFPDLVGIAAYKIRFTAYFSYSLGAAFWFGEDGRYRITFDNNSTTFKKDGVVVETVDGAGFNAGYQDGEMMVEANGTFSARWGPVGSALPEVWQLVYNDTDYATERIDQPPIILFGKNDYQNTGQYARFKSMAIEGL